MTVTVHDQLAAIRDIIRDAIQDGLLRGERLKAFNNKIKTLKGNELEDYLQDLWDSFSPSYPKA